MRHLKAILIALIVLTFATPVIAAELAPGLVGYWRMESETGGDTPDSSGAGNAGTVDGATAGTGLRGKGYAFATDDSINVGNGASLQITTAITVAAWVNGAAQSGKAVASKFDSGIAQRAWSLSVGTASASKLLIFLSDDGSWDVGHRKRYESSIVAFDNSWHHVAFTFDGSTLELYVDGVQDGSTNKVEDDAIAAIHNSTVAMMVGSLLVSGNEANFFTGSIDEVMVFNRALLEHEIRQVMMGFLQGGM